MKEFLTISQQIERIKEKGIIVNDSDIESVKKVLARENYYKVINGYKGPFLNKSKSAFIQETNINEIIALYYFDTYLKYLYLDVILLLENHIRTVVAYEFSKVYGSDHTEYLKIENFIGKATDKKSLLDKINNLIKKPQKEYIKHYKRKHKQIPLWVLINQFDLGTLIKFYEHIAPSLRNKICLQFNLKHKDFKRFLKLIKYFRNICAHNDRFYCERFANKIKNNSVLLDYFQNGFGIEGIQKTNSVFALTVMILHMSQPEAKEALIFGLMALNKYSNWKIKSVSSKKIFNIMGFPDNWVGDIQRVFKYDTVFEQLNILSVRAKKNETT